MNTTTITGHTKLTGLLGSPVAHSISPLMHNLAFDLLNIDYRYLCFDVTEDELGDAIKGIKAMNIAGFNLTMPCKNKVLDYLDELSQAASLIGAVNTVVNDHGRLVGHNTDGIGYMRSIEEAGFSIKGKHMTLLGAGGAGTSILVQAALDGVAEIDVFNRSTSRFHARAIQVVEELNKVTTCKVRIHDYKDEGALKTALTHSDILTNATSVGMAPNEDGCLIPDSSYLHSELIVSDIIYNPRETKLIQLAKEIGCPTCNGLYMLLFQGAAAFELWTNKKMPINEVKETYFQ